MKRYIKPEIEFLTVATAGMIAMSVHDEVSDGDQLGKQRGVNFADEVFKDDVFADDTEDEELW